MSNLDTECRRLMELIAEGDVQVFGTTEVLESIDEILQSTVHKSVQIGDELFRFDSFTQWVNKAQRWFRTCGERKHICIDARGRICLSGLEFARARDESSFPIVVYRIV